MRWMLFSLVLLCASEMTAASLWQAETLADGNLYADQVARKKGDLITILVQENTSVSETQKTELKRENDLAAAVTAVPFAQNNALAVLGKSQTGTLPALGANAKKEYKGDATYTADGTVKAVVTGRVVDVLDNGNLVVEGRRQVQVNNDTKTILITGLIRTADIRSDNTVASEKMHNFQVSIVGDGPMARTQQEGVLARLLDHVWPF